MMSKAKKIVEKYKMEEVKKYTAVVGGKEVELKTPDVKASGKTDFVDKTKSITKANNELATVYSKVYNIVNKYQSKIQDIEYVVGKKAVNLSVLIKFPIFDPPKKEYILFSDLDKMKKELEKLPYFEKWRPSVRFALYLRYAVPFK